MTPAAYPLTIYYDASCPLCATEMGALKARDQYGRLKLVDCSSPDFRDPCAAQAGLSRDALMQAIHARDASGRWLQGVDVFVVAYQAAGLDAIAALFAHPRLAPRWKRIYPWIARNRQRMSRLGFDALVRFVLQRTGRSSACSGACSTSMQR